jgi:hypothetical protein
MQENETIIKTAIKLAATWQKRANELITPQEKKRYKKLSRLLIKIFPYTARRRRIILRGQTAAGRPNS